MDVYHRGSGLKVVAMPFCRRFNLENVYRRTRAVVLEHVADFTTFLKLVGQNKSKSQMTPTLVTISERNWTTYPIEVILMDNAVEIEQFLP